MASPAAILSILVEANTAAATASLSKLNAEMDVTKANAVGATTATSRASSAFSKMGTVAKVGAAAGVAAFAIAAKKSIDTTEELAKGTISLHENLGLSTKAASEWAGVARSRGADSQKMGMAFKTLASNISAAGHGSATAIDMFKELGFSQKDIQKSMHDSNFAVGEVAKGFGSLPPSVDKATFAGKLFGRGWQTLFPVLRDGKAAMQDQLDTVDKYGGAFTGSNLKAWENYLAIQREMKVATQGVEVQIANALLPTLHKLDEQFLRIANIVANKKLTPEQKFNKVARIIRKDFETVLHWFLEHIPQMAEQAGKTGAEIAKGVVEGFLHADALGKLVIGAWLLKAFGGGAAIKSVGAKLAGLLFGTTAAGGAAGGLTTVATKADPVPVWVVNQVPGGGGVGGGAGGGAAAGAEATAAADAARAAAAREAAAKGLGPKMLGPEPIAPKAGMGFAEAATRSPLAVGGLLATGAIGFGAMGGPDVGQSIPNRLNAAGRAMDPTQVLHLVGLPALSDLLPAVQKLPPERIMDFALSGRTGPIGPTTRTGHAAGAPGQFGVTKKGKIVGGVDVSTQRGIGAQALPDIAGMVGPFASAGKTIGQIVVMLQKKYGSLSNAAGKMTKDQAHDFLRLAVQAKLPKPELAKLTMAYAKAGKLSGKDIKSLSKVTGVSAGIIRRTLHRATDKGAKDLKHFGDSTHSSGHNIKKWAHDAVQDFHRVMKGNDKLGQDTHKKIKVQNMDWTWAGRGIQNWGDSVQKAFKRTMDNNRKLGDNNDKTQGGMRDQSSKTKKQVSDDAAKQAQNVGKSYDNQNRAVSHGLGLLQNMTSSALQALGLPPINFSVGSSSGKKKRRGGAIGGTGSGDKVHALLEPGEFVMNRTAVKGIGQARLEAMNSALPRFAKGGSVTGDTAGLVPPFMSALGRMSAATHTGITVNSGFRSYQEQVQLYNAYLNGTGNLAAKPGTSHHELGIAADIAPGRETFGSVAGKFGLGFTVPTEAWHIELLNAAAAGAMGASWKTVARVLLDGPKGAIKNQGQGALDKVRKAANAYGRKKASKMGGAGSNIALGKGTLSRGEMRKLLKAHNLPDIMGWVAMAESGLDPSAHNSIGASGLWQFLPSTWSGLGVPGSPFDPNAAAVGANKLYGQSGLSPWEASRNAGAIPEGWGPHQGQPFRKGGRVLPPYGGNFAHGGTVPGPRGAPRTVVAHGGERVESTPKRYQITITNWKQGTGYMEEVADNAVNGQRRLGNQLSRMRRG